METCIGIDCNNKQSKHSEFCDNCLETKRFCHLCDGEEINKYCINETCYEYTRHEVEIIKQ